MKKVRLFSDPRHARLTDVRLNKISTIAFTCYTRARYLSVNRNLQKNPRQPFRYRNNPSESVPRHIYGPAHSRRKPQLGASREGSSLSVAPAKFSNKTRTDGRKFLILSKNIICKRKSQLLIVPKDKDISGSQSAHSARNEISTRLFWPRGKANTQRWTFAPVCCFSFENAFYRNGNFVFDIEKRQLINPDGWMKNALTMNKKLSVSLRSLLIGNRTLWPWIY